MVSFLYLAWYACWRDDMAYHVVHEEMLDNPRDWSTLQSASELIKQYGQFYSGLINV